MRHGAALGVAVSCAVAGGCLSSNDSPVPPVVVPTFDGGGIDASFPTFDAAVPAFDAGESPDAAGPVDAGAPDAGPVDAAPATASQVGVVGGGTSSRSAHYTLVGSTGPATAPPLHSQSYGLTGGMAASAQKN